MNQVQRVSRFILFGVWAVFMTALTYVLGAPPLKVLRRRLGRARYWLFLPLVSVGLFFFRLNGTGADGQAGLDFRMLSIGFLSLILLVGVFEEFEDMGFSLKTGTFFTLIINGLVAAGAFALWVSYTGPLWAQTLLTSIEQTLKPMVELNPKFQVSYAELMSQLPSFVVILWIVALYLAIQLEGWLGTGDMTPLQTHPSLKPQLLALRLPDACVWIFIASLLGTFGNFQIKGLEAISINFMNVGLVLFFFQGLAVISKFFETMRIGTFWQAILIFIIVVQLGLLASVLGLLDFWIGFRERLNKRTKQLKRETESK